MRRLIWLIIVIYVVLAVACSVLNPLFEAPDEQHHYSTALSIAETRRLPIVSARAAWLARKRHSRLCTMRYQP